MTLDDALKHIKSEDSLVVREVVEHLARRKSHSFMEIYLFGDVVESSDYKTVELEAVCEGDELRNYSTVAFGVLNLLLGEFFGPIDSPKKGAQYLEAELFNDGQSYDLKKGPFPRSGTINSSRFKVLYGGVTFGIHTSNSPMSDQMVKLELPCDS